jgi:hypothetical protein
MFGLTYYGLEPTFIAPMMGYLGVAIAVGLSGG